MKIALVSDTHLSARAPLFNANWQRARDWIGAQSFQAVIHLGDITADGIDDPGELAFARAAFDSLEDRIRFLPGNHDVGDNPPAPDAPIRHPLSSERLGQYHAVFGPGCWWFRAGSWQCIGLNAQLFGTGLEAETAQERWLRDVVAHDHGPLALFLHKPLFQEHWDEAVVHGRYVPVVVRRRLRTILPPDRLRLVISGHAHQAHRVDCEGAANFWIPSTAFCIPDALQERLGEKIVGLAVLDLTGDAADLRYVTPPGMIRHNLLEFEDLYPELDRLDPSLRHAAL